jgi:hypothetical protein
MFILFQVHPMFLLMKRHILLECKEEEILENESRQGNLNEIGSKRILSRTQCGWKKVEAQTCSSGGIWGITETKWEIDSTVESE